MPQPTGCVDEHQRTKVARLRKPYERVLIQVGREFPVGLEQLPAQPAPQDAGVLLQVLDERVQLVELVAAAAVVLAVVQVLAHVLDELVVVGKDVGAGRALDGGGGEGRRDGRGRLNRSVD